MKFTSTLGDSVVSIVTLLDDVMSDSFGWGGIGNGFGTLRDVCSFLRSVVFVMIIGCSVGAFVWAFGAWRLIRLLSAVASHSRSLIDVSPFTFDITLADCSIFRISLTTGLACMMVRFVMFLCWKTTVSDTRS